MWLFIKNNPAKLLEDFNNSNRIRYKSKIINRLIELRAEKELESLLDETYDEETIQKLIAFFQNNPNSLFKLIGHYENFNESIIKKLIELKAKKELSLLIDKDYNSLIIPFLIEENRNNPEELLQLYKKDTESDKTIIGLINNTQVFEHLIYSKPLNTLVELINTNEMTISEFIKSYGTLISLLFTTNRTGLLFFDRLENKYKVYLLLYHFSITDYIPCENIQIDLAPIGKFYNSFNDSVFHSINEVVSLFDKVFSDGLKELNETKLKLALLINTQAYSDKIKKIKSDHNLVYDIQKEKSKIIDSYTEKIHNANDKSEIENLIKSKNNEITKLYSKERFDILEGINDFCTEYNPSDIEFNFTNSQEIDSAGKIIDLIRYSNIRIVKDYQIEKDKIVNSHKNELKNMSNPNLIMKAKDKYNKEMNNLISEADFIASVNYLTENQLSDETYIYLLGNILISSNSQQIVKSMLFATQKINNSLWLPYISKVPYNDQTKWYIIDAVKNKFSSKNLDLLLSDFSTDFNEIGTYSHNSYVKSVEFSPDGKYLASGSDDYTVKLVQVSNFNEIGTYRHNGYVTFVAFSPDGKYLASCSKDYTVKLVQVSNFNEVGTYSHDSYVKSVSFSPDGKYLTSSSDDYNVKLVQVSNFNEISTFSHKCYITYVAFSPDGKYLASSSNDYTVKLMQVSNFNEVGTYRHNGDVTFVAFSPDGKYLASSSNDYTVKLMQVSNFKEVGTYSHNRYVTFVAFSPDGKYLAIGVNDYTVKLMQVSNFKEVGTYMHNGYVTFVVFSPDGKYLAIGDNDYTVSLVQISNFYAVGTYRHNSGVTSIAFSPDGKYLASCSNDYTVKLVQVSNFNEVSTYSHDSYVKSVAFSPDGKYLASSSDDYNVRLMKILIIDYLVLFEHLIYLYYCAGIEDIKHLKDALDNLNNLPEKMQASVKKIIENIIERAGKESKTIEVTSNNYPNSKDIEVK